MKKSRFSDSQIISILKQAKAGTPAAKLCCEHGMSNALFYTWRRKFRDTESAATAPIPQGNNEISSRSQ